MPKTRREIAREVDEILSSGSGCDLTTQALTRRVRELETKMRATGAALANFVGEDAAEGAELAAMSRELLAFADAGTRL